MKNKVEKDGSVIYTTMKIKNDLIIADKLTANNHLYSRKILQTAIDEYNSRENQFGMLDSNYIELRPREISHRISNIVLLDDDSIEGDIKILETPYGIILQELVDNNKTINFSFKGIGTLEDNIIQEDYKILYTYITFEGVK